MAADGRRRLRSAGDPRVGAAAPPARRFGAGGLGDRLSTVAIAACLLLLMLLAGAFALDLARQRAGLAQQGRQAPQAQDGPAPGGGETVAIPPDRPRDGGSASFTASDGQPGAGGEGDAGDGGDGEGEPRRPAREIVDEVPGADGGGSGTTGVVVAASVPEGVLDAAAEMRAEWVADADMTAIGPAAKAAIEDDGGRPVAIRRMHVVDISFVDAQGAEALPDGEMGVRLSSAKLGGAHEIGLVRLVGDGAGGANPVAYGPQPPSSPLLDGDGAGGGDGQGLRGEVIHGVSLSGRGDVLGFTAPSAGEYAVCDFEYVAEGTCVVDGESWSVTASYGVDAGMPEGAGLRVSEIGAGSARYEGYVARSEQAMGIGRGAAGYVRLFDIAIVAGGEERQPAAGSAVSVSIRLDDMPGAVVGGDGGEAAQAPVPGVVHFGEQPEVLASSTEGSTVSFEAGSFSVYAVIAAPDPYEEEFDPDVVAAATGLEEEADGLFLSLVRGGATWWVTGTDNGSGCLAEAQGATSAAAWRFEPVGGVAGRYLMWLDDGAGGRLYLRHSGIGNANSVDLVADASSATPVDVSVVAGTGGDGTRFTIKKVGDGRWLQHSNGGGGVRFWTDKNNAANSQFALTRPASVTPTRDPYGLDGRSFGIAWVNGEISAVALTTDVVQAGTKMEMVAQRVTVRPDVVEGTREMFVASHVDIAMYTFHCVAGDMYRLSTEVDGEEMWLAVGGLGVRLVADESQATALTMTPGTGEDAGAWCVSADSRTLTLANADVTKNFMVGTMASPGRWLSLVSKVDFDEDDFMNYSARKVSVSDLEAVADGTQVIIYTRVWNPDTLRYEFYAIDHDGGLLRCYESGDTIEWIGGAINTALWDFIEYSRDDGSPTWYFDLRNAYSGAYIAPQIGAGSALSDDAAIGVNLNGRRYGDDSTTIIAWDDPHYEYAGICVDGDHIAPCSIAQAGDFYFAILGEVVPGGGDLTTVSTVDNAEHGITMRMVDFNNGKEPHGNGDVIQNPFFGGDKNEAGILSTSLNDQGYPVTTMEVTGHEDPISDLFTGMTDVNHLFLLGTYNESGYFEYNSTENFAHLDDDGDFVVYDQLGCIGTDTRMTRTHGQFMPYNDLDPDIIAPVTNDTDLLGEPLPDIAPRKGEQLYMIPQAEADYYFGMEMEASFVQTPSGLDAWGHDIIFEFSGDDDFWLYVDGELVLDIGGVHSASTGKVNFRTGQVEVVNRMLGETIANRTYVTTLWDLFKSNYEGRNPQATQEEVLAYLDGIFEDNGEGQMVFKDYTPHTMKVFYMERGAGASNLHMRFNLAAAKPGVVTVSKSISGTDKQDYALASFPYQVWWRPDPEDDSSWRLLELEDHLGPTVTIAGHSTPAPTRSPYVPAGGSHQYRNVFFVKPGQSVEVRLPGDAVEYYVAEVGIDPAIYDAVTANGVPVPGTDEDGDGLHDHAIPVSAVGDRPAVGFDNHVDESAMRTLEITKRLCAEDGVTEQTAEQDPTTFNFRLWLSDADNDLAAAYVYPYHVKSPDGHYCMWDVAQRRFVATQISSLDAMTDAERSAMTFYTSINGSISKIPVGYFVEVRDLVVGSRFMVFEREDEIPMGYSLVGYDRVDSSYIIEPGMEPNEGVVRDNSSPAIMVTNRRGWELGVTKEWSDASFMESHDDVYVGVFRDGQLVAGSVRRLREGAWSARWYFDSLPLGGAMADYAVHEVILGGEVTLADDGVTVTGWGSLQEVAQGQQVQCGGTPAGGGHRDDLVYVVSYGTGQPDGALGNVRSDTISNVRPGLVVTKAAWDGSPLAGAMFTLVDANGDPAGAGMWSSGADGLVTIAYLDDGDYVLSESSAPTGYVALAGDITITASGGSYSVAGPADGWSFAQVGRDGMPTIEVRDRSSSIVARKVDEAGQPLAGAAFAIYRLLRGSDGTWRRDYFPVAGWERLVSQADGTIATGIEALPAGSYTFVETEAPAGYGAVTLPFAIGADGAVTLIDGTNGSIFTSIDGGVVSCSITVVNALGTQRVRVMKVDASDRSVPLQGAVFDLYRVIGSQVEATPTVSGLASRADGILEDAAGDTLTLPVGTYHLVEVTPPDGYLARTSPVTITVTLDGVTYDDGTAASQEEGAVTYVPSTESWLIRVADEPIAPGQSDIPLSGEDGIARGIAIGIALTSTCLTLLVAAERRRAAAEGRPQAGGDGRRRLSIAERRGRRQGAGPRGWR